jgi:hypothetical protein
MRGTVPGWRRRAAVQGMEVKCARFEEYKSGGVPEGTRLSVGMTQRTGVVRLAMLGDVECG